MNDVMKLAERFKAKSEAGRLAWAGLQVGPEAGEILRGRADGLDQTWQVLNGLQMALTRASARPVAAHGRGDDDLDDPTHVERGAVPGGENGERWYSVLVGDADTLRDASGPAYSGYGDLAREAMQAIGRAGVLPGWARHLRRNRRACGLAWPWLVMYLAYQLGVERARVTPRWVPYQLEVREPVEGESTAETDWIDPDFETPKVEPVSVDRIGTWRASGLPSADVKILGDGLEYGIASHPLVQLAAEGVDDIQVWVPRVDVMALSAEVLAALGRGAEVAEPAEETGGGDVMSGEDRALAVLTRHPEWTDKRIAEAAGISRGQLYRYERFKEARRVQKSAGLDAIKARQDRRQAKD